MQIHILKVTRNKPRVYCVSRAACLALFYAWPVVWYVGNCREKKVGEELVAASYEMNTHRFVTLSENEHKMQDSKS